jgi:RNA polymerase sigma factor (sigma-70 family)
MPTAAARIHDPVNLSDRALMQRVAAGNGEAFDALYRRHSRHLLMLARKLCASPELAEEVTQEAFVSIWRSAHCYRPALGSVSVWLSSIVRNRATDAWRRAAVRPVEVPALDDGPGQLRSAIGADTPAPERAVVLALIAELPGPQKEAVFLAYFAGMTQEEIATWSGAPLGTVKGRIRTGMQKIRAGLEAQSVAAAAPSVAAVPPSAVPSVAAVAPSAVPSVAAVVPSAAASIAALAPSTASCGPAAAQCAPTAPVVGLDVRRRCRYAPAPVLTPRRAAPVA